MLYNWKSNFITGCAMKWAGMFLVVGAAAVVLFFDGAAYSAEPGVMALTPDEMKWSAQGGLALPGMEQVNLIGDPGKPGPYTLRLRFPAGFKLPPHFHPDAREVTVLSGVWYTGYGETADPAKLKKLPAGSFYTEPANEPHFVEVREPTVIQVSGTGPSGRKDIAPK
jgi:quercetin dioxygenase-like cupin family protein